MSSQIERRITRSMTRTATQVSQPDINMVQEKEKTYKPKSKSKPKSKPKPKTIAPPKPAPPKGIHPYWLAKPASPKLNKKMSPEDLDWWLSLPENMSMDTLKALLYHHSGKDLKIPDTRPDGHWITVSHIDGSSPTSYWEPNVPVTPWAQDEGIH